jgi:hypothetical protein
LGRHKFVVLLLGIVSLASISWFLVDVLGMFTRTKPSIGVAEFENRYSRFPKPEARTLFGYASDYPPNDPRTAPEFHLTQYALAPALVKPVANLEFVILNYHTDALDFRFLQANHLEPVQDFGNGVALCRRARR